MSFLHQKLSMFNSDCRKFDIYELFANSYLYAAYEDVGVESADADVPGVMARVDVEGVVLVAIELRLYGFSWSPNLTGDRRFERGE